MIELTYDPDARTLYTYFAPIDEGQDAAQIELDGFFLLDKAGHILGMHVDLGEGYTPRLLHYALEHDQVRFEQRSASFRIIFAPEQPASHIDFPYPAIVDLDRSGHALGIEFIADPEFGLAQRLRFAEPFIVEVFSSTDEDGDEPDQRAPEPNARAQFGVEPPKLRDATVGVGLAPASHPQAGASPTPTPQSTDVQDLTGALAGQGVQEPPVTEAALPEEQVRSGFVALVGKPNVGKSTLLNAYLGTKVSIVSPKPQTTRVALRGMLNRDDAQIVFIDTPGMHQPRSRLGEFMVESARRSLPDADVVCFVIDASEPPSQQDRRIAELIKRFGKPAILVLNKVDIARHADVVLQQYRELGPWESEVAVSAKLNQGLAGLLEEIVARLPEGPRLFPIDQFTDLSEREHVAELIREKVLLNTQQEVPHGVAIEVEEWAARGERLYIRATINVERDGHKGIIIGEHGQMLKKIGAAARYEIELAVGRAVFLDLWVKVRKDWRSDPSSLRWLGYDLKRLT